METKHDAFGLGETVLLLRDGLSSAHEQREALCCARGPCPLQGSRGDVQRLIEAYGRYR